MRWSAEFDPFPVKLPNGKELVTLSQARAYIMRLPKDVAEQPLWQKATRQLLLAAEHGGPFLFIARISMLTAIHGPVVRPEGLNAAERIKANWAAKRKRSRPGG